MRLTPDQHRHYADQGYLLASGLISDDVASDAEYAMDRLMKKDPDEFVEARGVVIFNGAQDPELLACATPSFLEAIAQLIGEPVDHPPEAVHTQNLLPREDGQWQNPTPHVDGIPREHMHETFPGPYRIAALVFLSDVEERGGGTAVWPGSHRKIRALAESDPAKYRYLFDLNKDIPSLDLGDPLVLAPRRGDVLFFQHLFGHNGTRNLSNRTRYMMRWFCSCPTCFSRWKKTDTWGHWSP